MNTDINNLRIENIRFSAGELVNRYKAGEIILQPTYQRPYVWSDKQKTLLIESILIGLPIPNIFLSADESDLLEVLDGQQRLTTIIDFIDGKFELTSDLNYLKDLEGSIFKMLMSPKRREIQRFGINATIISKASDAIKLDIFTRLNTLGTPMDKQHIEGLK